MANNEQHGRTTGSRWRVLLGLFLAFLSLLTVLGGLRVALLLLFAFECGFQACELAVIPLAAVSYFLCRSRSPESMRPFQRLGMAFAASAVVAALFLAAMIQWALRFPSGGFP